MDNLRHNVSINAALTRTGPLLCKDITATAQVHHLEWGEANAASRVVCHSARLVAATHLHSPDLPHLARQFDPVDVAVGSEVIYLSEHVDLLMKVLDAYLLPEGVFYQICAQEREVSHFPRFERSIKVMRWLTHNVLLPLLLLLLAL